MCLGILWQPWAKGGMGLPDVKKYNVACLLRHARDWIWEMGVYTPLTMIRELVRPLHLRYILHVKSVKGTDLVTWGVLLDPVHNAWKYLCKGRGILANCSPYLLIRGNEEFRPGISGKSFARWSQLGIVNLEHLVTAEGKIVVCYPQDAIPLNGDRCVSICPDT